MGAVLLGVVEQLRFGPPTPHILKGYVNRFVCGGISRATGSGGHDGQTIETLAVHGSRDRCGDPEPGHHGEGVGQQQHHQPGPNVSISPADGCVGRVKTNVRAPATAQEERKRVETGGSGIRVPHLSDGTGEPAHGRKRRGWRRIPLLRGAMSRCWAKDTGQACVPTAPVTPDVKQGGFGSFV